MFAIGTNVLYAYSQHETWSAIVAEVRPKGYYGPSLLIEFDGIVVPEYAANGSMAGPQGSHLLEVPLSIDAKNITRRPLKEDDSAKRAAWSDLKQAYARAAAAAAALKDDATFASFTVGATVTWKIDKSVMWQTRIETHTGIIKDLDRASMTANIGLPERMWLGHLTLVD
jgi:hypothetical protein